MTEGVIKFRCDWTREPVAVGPEVLAGILCWRSRLREAGLIGVLPDGIGFGNLSVRVDGAGVEGAPLQVAALANPEDDAEGPDGPPLSLRPRFLVTGSGTGGLAELDASHCSLVTDYRLEENFLACRGLTQASSESLSHGAVYAARPDVGAVIHVHSEALWKRWWGVLPTTDPAFEYGTPEIALALGRLAREPEPASRRERTDQVVGGEAEPGGEGPDAPAPGTPGAIVMGGHRDGLVIFGGGLDGAGEELLKLVEKTALSLPPSTGDQRE